MAEESDGIEEAFEGQLRVLITLAGQMGERFARAREQAMRNAQAASEQEARELASRLAAEQATARTELANVYRDPWWSQTTPEQVAHTYQVARAWSDQDPDAARAQAHMGEQIRTRYGIDVDHPGADPAILRAALERAEHDRTRSDAEHTRAAADTAEAQQLMQQADRDDAAADRARVAAEHEPDPDDRVAAAAQAEQLEGRAGQDRQDGRVLYDSAERREGTARDLESKGIDHELVATRMRADVSQAKPAREAVKVGPSRSAKTQRGLRSRGVQAQRTGVER